MGILGALHVTANQLRDPADQVVVLRGANVRDPAQIVLGWGGFPTGTPGLQRAVDLATAPNFASNCIRLPIYPRTPADEYNSGSSRFPCEANDAGNQVYFDTYIKPVLDYAVTKGIYVIVDWHRVAPILSDNVAESGGQGITGFVQAQRFWTWISSRIAPYDNVIAELWNEPDDANGTWASGMKARMQTLYTCARSGGFQGIVIVGSAQYDQEPDLAAADPFTTTTGGAPAYNLTYSLHLYYFNFNGSLLMRNGSMTMAQMMAAAALRAPCVLSEYGSNGGSYANFQTDLKTYADANKISRTAWICDNEWGPFVLWNGNFTALTAFGIWNQAWMTEIAATGLVTAPKWNLVYWQAYAQNWSQPTNFDVTAGTHYALGVVFCTAAGGFTYGYQLSSLANSNTDRAIPGTSTDMARVTAMCAEIHAKGGKAVCMIGGSGDNNFTAAASTPATRANFASTIVNWCAATGLDGVDLDWENGVPIVSGGTSTYCELVRAIRAVAPPSFIITVAAGNSGSGSAWRDMAGIVHPLLDQFNIMTYDMGGGTWWGSALSSPAENGRTGLNCAANMTYAMAAGCPSTKVGIGIPFYGEAGSHVNYTDLAPRYRTDTYHYDTGAQVPEFTTGTWNGFEDEASVLAKAAHVKANRYGGAIEFTNQMSAWTVGTASWGWRRDPLLDAAKRGFLERPPTKMTRPATTSFSAGGGVGTGTLTISGLGLSYLWWDRMVAASGFDLRANPSNAGWSDGVPTDYTIQASANGGTSWTTLVTITGNNYVTRLHALNLTGYNRVRMVVTATHDGAAGACTVDLWVYDLAGGTGDDAWLFIGDSITSNMFDGNIGWTPTSRFTDWISGRDSARWPVALCGGIDGGTIPNCLRTDIRGDGGPLIRSWMEDFPGKYVSLGIGHNDINAGTSADTMQGWYRTLIKEVLAAGKTVVLPRLRWINTNGATTGTLIAAWNLRVAQLQAEFPSCILGPDLYTNSYNHPEWLTDGTHLSTAGAQVSYDDWTNWAVATVYAGVTPAVVVSPTRDTISVAGGWIASSLITSNRVVVAQGWVQNVTLTVDVPGDGMAVTFPFDARGVATPGATVTCYNDGTGSVLGSATATDGTWTMTINGTGA